MIDRPKFFDDIAGVAGGAVSVLAGLKEELAALVKARVEEALRRLDLVSREEFDAMAELARRAREQADALEQRVAALEKAGEAKPDEAQTAQEFQAAVAPEQPEHQEPTESGEPA